MAYSSQTEVSDGTLQTVILSIAFFDKTEIHVYRDGVEIFSPVDFVWATSNSIQFAAPQAAGVTIQLRRTTDISEMRHIFTEGAAFTNQTLDEDYTQILHIAQESAEGGNLTDVFNPLNMHQNQLKNMAPGTDPSDAATLGQIESIVAGSPALLRSVRTALTDAPINPLPAAADRVGKLLSFDVDGNPVAIAAAGGSAAQLEIDLADAVTAGKGANKVAFTGGGTVQNLAFLQDVDDHVDPTKGAARIGRAIRFTTHMAELRTIDGQYDGEVISLRGYYNNYPGKGGGEFVWSSTSTLPDDSGTVIKAVAATGRWLRSYDRLYVSHFGAVPDTGADRSAALQAARDYIQAQLLPSWLGFKNGRYTYSVAQNWAINDAHIAFEGEVRLRYTGTGAAVMLDGQNNGGNIYRLKFGWGNGPIIEAPTTAGDGVYLTSVHHSKIGAVVVGAGATFAGLRIKFAVCTQFDIQVSKNPDGAWYSGTAPQYGVYATELNPGELCSYCTFTAPILEHLPVGMYMDHAFGNYIYGGTMEGCGTGQFMTINAFNNKTCYVDYEVNTDHDVYCLGRENYWLYCDTEKQITMDGTAVNNWVQGGAHSDIVATVNTAHNVFRDLVYNRNADGSVIDDQTVGKKNLQECNINRGAGRVEVNGIPGSATLSPPAAPATYTYTNNSVSGVRVFVVGGTVSNVTITRNGNTFGAGEVAGSFFLAGGDALAVTYGAVPTMYVLT